MRGKHAARAATSRAEQLSAELDALRAKTSKEADQYRGEIADLKAEIQRLQGRLISEVQELATGEIRRAREAARLEVAHAAERHHAAVLRAGKFMKDKGVTLPDTQDWLDLASILGARLADLVDEGGTRSLRRMSNKAAHKNLKYKENVARAGRPDLGKP